MRISITPITLTLTFALTSVVAYSDYANWHTDVNDNNNLNNDMYVRVRRDNRDPVHVWYRRGPHTNDPSGSANKFPKYYYDPDAQELAEHAERAEVKEQQLPSWYQSARYQTPKVAPPDISSNPRARRPGKQGMVAQIGDSGGKNTQKAQAQSGR